MGRLCLVHIDEMSASVSGNIEAVVGLRVPVDDIEKGRIVYIFMAIGRG